MAQVTFPALQKKIVYYDLKTTDSKSVPTREIVSIGAICNFSTDISLFFGNGIGDFFVEIPPTHGINPQRSKLYGYTIQNEKLFYTDKSGSKRWVAGAVSMKQALEKFIQYLNGFPNCLFGLYVQLSTFVFEENFLTIHNFLCFRQVNGKLADTMLRFHDNVKK